MKQQKYVVNGLKLLTIPLLIGGLVKCGKSSTSPSTTPTTTTPTPSLDGYVMIGFTPGTASTGSLDTAASGTNKLGTISATEPYGSYKNSADSFGYALAIKDIATKNMLFSFRANEIYANPAINTASFKINVADKAFAASATAYIDSTNKTAFSLTDLTAAANATELTTQFGAAKAVGSVGVGFLPTTAGVTTTWGKAGQIPEVTYAGVATSYGAAMTTNAQYSIFSFAPKIGSTNLDGTKAKINATVAVLKDTDFAAGIYSTSGTAAPSYDTPVNGFSAKSSVASAPVLIVPSLAGFGIGGNAAQASATGLCAAAPTAGTAGGFTNAGVLVTGAASTITFSGKIWVPTGGDKGLALHVPRLTSATAGKIGPGTITFALNGAAATNVALTGNGSAAGTPAAATAQYLKDIDVLFATGLSMNQGAWNTVVITFKNDADTARIGCDADANAMGAMNLYTYTATAALASVTAATSDLKIGGAAITTTTLFPNASGSVPATALSTAKTVQSSFIRFVAQ